MKYTVGKNVCASAGGTRYAGSMTGLGNPPEKEVEKLSSMLSWKIPWIDKPCTLVLKELHRVGQDWAWTNTCAIFKEWDIKLNISYMKISFQIFIYEIMNIQYDMGEAPTEIICSQCTQ